MALRIPTRFRKYHCSKTDKKDMQKNSDICVQILMLKSSSDGGILDPDDHLSDVADDREKIIAIYEEQQSSCSLYNNGDGISAGSVGTGSPDITNEDKVDDVQRKQNSRLNADARQVSSGTASSPELSLTAHYTSAEDVKEVISTKNQNNSELSLRESEAVPINNSLTSNEDKFGFTRLGPRCSVRLSMLSNSKDSWRWEEAAEKQLLMTKNKERKEPLGRPITMTYSEEKSQENDAQILTLKNGPGPLGIHIVPDHDSCGRGNGLRVQGVEPGSKVDKDGRLQVSDRIVEINQQNLVHVDFPEAQEIFKNALQSPEIEFRLGKKSESFSECLSPSSERIKSTSSEERIDIQRKKLQEDEEKGPKSDIRISTPINTVSFGQKNVLLTSNTRKMGRKLNVQLTKGPDGLGFSITTRDNPALGFCPIYIKNILPKGAAVKDGRLKPGDRLLKVNQIEVTGLSQAEAAAVLRNVSPGGVVNLLVSRQDVDTLSNLPRKIPPEKASDGINIYPWQYKEVFTFDIPLNDTGSAGLGISVKGHTSVTPSGPVDLGIFIKSIIHGGAVSKDGRLMADDQLLSINGISLLDMTNTEALKTVRKTMTQNEGPNVYPGAISLTVARIIVSPSVDEVGNENDSSVSFNDLNDSVFSSGSDSRCGSAEGSFIHNSFAKTEDRISVERGKNFEDGMSLDPRTVCTLNSNSDFDENMNQRESKHLEKKNLIFNPPLLSSRNPMVDRLTGQGYYSQTKPRNTLHSESDLCASHENCNDHQLYQARCDIIKSNGHTGKNTVQVPTDNRVSTHNEEVNQLLHSKNHPESPHNILSTLENEDKKDDKVESKATQNNTDNLISSPDEDSFNLSRDGIGRHSISEKRHAKLDARKTNTFKRSKRAREEQEHLKQHQRNDQDNLTRHLQIVDLQYKQSVLENTHYRDQFLDKSHADAKENGNIQKMPLEVKPLKKSSSLESIENVVPELKKDSSAAVKNIDGQERFSTACRPSEVALEMNNQSENGSLISVESYGCSPLAAVLNRPPVSSDRTPDDVISPDYRLSKKKRLLKGLGSMFKFGKNKTSKVSGTTEKVQDDELKMKGDEKNQTKESSQDDQEKIPENYRGVAYRDKQNRVLYRSARCFSTNHTRPSALITENICQEQEQRVAPRQPDLEKRGHYVKNKKDNFHEIEIKEPLVQQSPGHPLLPQVYAQFCQPRRILPKVFTSHHSHPALIQRAQSLRFPNVKSAFSEQRDATDVLHNRSCWLETSTEDTIYTQLDPVMVNHYNSHKEVQNQLQQEQQLQSKDYQQFHSKGHQQLQSLHLRHHTEPPRQLASPTSNFRRDRSASAYCRIGEMQPKFLPTNTSFHSTCIPAQVSRATKPSPSNYDHHHHSTVQPNVYEASERWTVQNIGYLDRQLTPHYSLEKSPSLKYSSVRSHQGTRVGY